MVEYFAVFQQYLFVPSCLLPVSYLKIHRRGFLTSADPFPPPPQVLDLASSAVSPPTAGNAGGSRTSTEPLQSCVASSPRTRPTGSWARTRSCAGPSSTSTSWTGWWRIRACGGSPRTEWRARSWRTGCREHRPQTPAVRVWKEESGCSSWTWLTSTPGQTSRSDPVKPGPSTSVVNRSLVLQSVCIAETSRSYVIFTCIISVIVINDLPHSCDCVGPMLYVLSEQEGPRVCLSHTLFVYCGKKKSLMFPVFEPLDCFYWWKWK